LSILLAKLVNGGLEFSVLSAEGYDLTIHCGWVLDKAFVLQTENIDGILHAFESVIAALAFAGQPTYGCSDGWD
jgi:hypothetical protein